MPTFLFDKVIFGPLKSRRLGLSLGVNLMPVNKKTCSFDCIYCECGLNGELGDKKGNLPTRTEVRIELEKKLKEMVLADARPDVITFAGNGEPTMHPQFDQIIDDTITLRNTLCPQARIAVLSNASRIHQPPVFNALLKIDDNIQKLDSAIFSTIKAIDQPNYPFDLESTLANLKNFEGEVIIQTMFLSGEIDGCIINNTTPEEVNAWLEALAYIKPKKVMIYSIDRDTPYQTLNKIELTQLNEIAKLVQEKGFDISVAG